MKKSLLALAVASIAAASAASAATVYDKDGTSMEVYGRVQAVAYSTHGSEAMGSNSYYDNSIQTSGRLGLNLRTPLTDNIAAFANAEWDVADNDGTRDDNGDDSFSARYLFVGADFGKYGALQAGRFEDAVYQGVTAYTDVYEDWGCYGQLADGDKRDGMIMYSWSGYGFDFAATYGTAKDSQSVEGAWYSDEELDIDNSYSVAVGYSSPDVLFGPISVRLGFGSAHFQDDVGSAIYDSFGNNVTYDRYNQYAALLSWGSIDVGPYIAAMYNIRDFSMVNSELDYKVQGVEAVLAYGFECGVSIRTGYQWLNNDPDNEQVSGYKNSDAHIIPVYVNYDVSPNFNVWAEARYDAGTDNDFVDETLTENTYSVGARYTF